MSNLVCVTSGSGLKYGLVSNVAWIFEYLCGKMFNCFTFNVYYCLFSIFFMMLLKQLSNIKKIVLKWRGLQKKSQLSGGFSWRMGAPKKLRGGGYSKGMDVFLEGGFRNSKETMSSLCQY